MNTSLFKENQQTGMFKVGLTPKHIHLGITLKDKVGRRIVRKFQ